MDLPQDLAEIRAIVARMPIRRVAAGRARHARIALFAATREGDSAEEARAAIAGTEAGDFADRARAADCDVRVYELDIDHPVTRLADDELARAIAYGMMAIEPGPDLFCLAGLGDADGMLRAVTAGIERHTDAMALLGQRGGRDTACLFGAIIAARMAVTPVVIDGPQATAAASLIHAIAPHALTHCHIPEGSPYRDAGLRLGIGLVAFAPQSCPVSLPAAIEAWRLAPHGLA